MSLLMKYIKLLWERERGSSQSFPVPVAAKIKCLLLSDWSTTGLIHSSEHFDIFIKREGWLAKRLQARSGGWASWWSCPQVKNFYVRKQSFCTLRGFITFKYKGSILTLAITWLHPFSNSNQTKTGFLSRLFWSEGKAISKYKDRLYFLVNSKIAFAALPRPREETKFSRWSFNNCSSPEPPWQL